MQMHDFIRKELGALDPESVTALCLDREIVPDTYQTISGMNDFPLLEDFSAAGHEIEDPAPVGSAVNLKKLTLSYNKISDVSSLASLAKLEFLDLSFNQLRNLNGLGQLSKLEELHLEFNHLQSVAALKNLAQLSILGLSGNRNLRSLEGLENLKNLRELYLNQVLIPEPEILAGLPALERMVLSYPESWVNTLNQLPALRSLSIFGNINTDVIQLPNLPELHHIKLHRIPGIAEIQGWQQLKNLRSLEITRCELERFDLRELPESIERIDIRNSRITTIEGKEILDRLNRKPETPV